MRYPAYPNYKPSGVEWLGDVPVHWEVKQLKWAVMFQRGHDLPADDREEGLVPLVSSSGVSATHLRAAARGPGIVTGRYGTIGQFYLVKEDYWPLNTTLYSIDLHGNEPRFLQLMLTHLSPLFLLNAVKSAVPGVDRNDIHPIRAAVPPVSEQRAIADYLDKQTAKLDTLMAKKRALIEKLKEKRTALISRTVTRGLPPDAARAAGLDPYPKLKPSDIDWLGDVPAHWEVLAARRVSEHIKTGSTPPTAETEYYKDGIVPWFGPGSFDDQITLSKPVKLISQSAVRDGAARLFRAGATMVVTIGATLGKVSSLLTAGSCNQQITVIEFNERRVLPRFGTYQLRRLESALRAVAPSATLPILSQSDIADVVLALPPLTEQRTIADYLDRETAKIDRMVAKVEAAIERLQEYRTALITAAVTGKIDVRGAHA